VIPSEHFNAVLYTGNGTDASTTQVITTDIQPDLVWMKCRSNLTPNRIVDAVRGVDVTLYSDTTNGDYANAGSDITAFGSTSFTLTGDGAGTNSNGRTYVAWNWKANGTGVSNTNGSINTTKTSANVDAGFSISTYAGNDTNNATVGHGLSKAPELVIIKNKYTTAAWEVYEASTDNRYQLNNTSAGGDDFDINYGTNPSATLVSLSSGAGVNRNPDTYVMYCWHSVDGYSKVGSYTGNGSTDGTFVYTGFRPAYVMVKVTNLSGESWLIKDSERATDNPTDLYLYADQSIAETGSAGATRYLDLLSNGFKWRGGSVEVNGSYTYIYLAFAESPFKHTNAK
jgi:hypothetical protein